MENTPKNFALQLGSLITLYVSISALISLLLSIITILYPDPAQGYFEYDGAAGSIRFSIALLAVFFPAYLILTRTVNVLRRRELSAYLGLTRWLIYLSLLIGGATLLGDLVAVINGFLNGELTVRFLLKAFVVLVIVGAAFLYYLLDAREYWQTHERTSTQYAAVTALIVILSLVFGFMRIETPAVVREMKIDTQEIIDLSSIQSNIQQFYELQGSLPQSLSDAYPKGLIIPIAPFGRDAYVYTVTGTSSFKLCTSFAYPTSKSEQMMIGTVSAPTMVGTLVKNANNWDHGAGAWCFDRAVVPLSPNQKTS